MRKLEMKIAIPEVKGGRLTSTELKDGYILAKFEIGENHFSSKSEMECRIDPTIFEGEWLKHHPTTQKQKETLALYQDAKANGRLHAFTCMTVDPSIKDGKLVYQKGLPPAVGVSQIRWLRMLEEYDPSRNSRQMTKTEYACRNLFIIQKLVESGCEIEEAWIAVCDDSKKIGHYRNQDKPKDDFELTGTREVCGFCDLANTWKFLAKDPWDEDDATWTAGGSCNCDSSNSSVATLRKLYYEFDIMPDGVAELALD